MVLVTSSSRISLWDAIISLFAKRKQEEEDEENSRRVRMEGVELTEEEKLEIVEILIDNQDKELIQLCSRYAHSYF